MKATILGAALIIFGVILMIPLLVDPSAAFGHTTGLQSQIRAKSPAALKVRHSMAGSFAAFIVAVGLMGPLLVGQSIPTLLKLRHDILMMDREFERSSMRINPWFTRTTALVQDEVKWAGRTRSKAQLREATL